MKGNLINTNRNKTTRTHIMKQLIVFILWHSNLQVNIKWYFTLREPEYYTVLSSIGKHVGEQRCIVKIGRVRFLIEVSELDFISFYTEVIDVLPE